MSQFNSKTLDVHWLPKFPYIRNQSSKQLGLLFAELRCNSFDLNLDPVELGGWKQFPSIQWKHNPCVSLSLSLSLSLCLIRLAHIGTIQSCILFERLKLHIFNLLYSFVLQFAVYYLVINNTYMGMALKTLWIVPRWSGRLERGDYVKGHDPEVSKAPNDMTWNVYMSLWLDQRSHGKVERSGIEVPNFMDCESTAWSKEGNQTITSF